MIVRNAAQGKRKIKQCLYCANDIVVVKWEAGTKKYCSRECTRLASKAPRFDIPCSLDGCSSVIYMTEKQQQKTERHYCSRQCGSVAGRLIAQKLGKKTGTKPELAFERWCIENGVEYVSQFNVPWQKGWKKWYDFYLPQYHLLVEIDGVYWHGKGKAYKELNEQQRNTRNNDIVKNQLAVDRGYNLLRIWEDDLEKFKIQKIIQL